MARWVVEEDEGSWSLGGGQGGERNRLTSSELS